MEESTVTHTQHIRAAFTHMRMQGSLPPSVNWRKDVFARIYHEDSCALVQHLFGKLLRKHGKRHDDVHVCALWNDLRVPMTRTICAAALQQTAPATDRTANGPPWTLTIPFHAQLAVFGYLHGMVPTAELVNVFRTPKDVAAFEDAYGEQGAMWLLYERGHSVPLSVHVSVCAVQQHRHAVSSYIFRTRPLESDT
jgi:hypothetical protein